MVGAFHRGEITLRKLRVLVEYLPQDSPARWHLTEGKPYTVRDDVAWHTLWLLLQVAVQQRQIAGDKNAKMPADTRPRYPWSEIKSSTRSLGSVAPERREEVLDYLENL